VCAHCSRKRICEGCGEERDLAELDHKRVEKQRCKTCTGATPEQDRARDLEKCHHCPETFFREAWTQVERNDIRMKRKRVICDTCQEAGLTPRNGEIYICGGAGCETRGGVGKFDAAAFASWSRESRRGVLLCRTCAPGRTLTAPRICEGCGEERDLAEFDHKRVEQQRCKTCTGATPEQDRARDLEKCHHCPETFFREAWTQVERHNIRMKRKRVICDTCEETGRTPRNGEIYICGGAGCETKGGVGKFDAAALAAWSRKSRRGVLLCRTCAPGRTLTAPQKRKTL
jgi:hypothetical protein